MANRFVLLTAAKNEERYIAGAIESVLRQRVRPAAWIIIDDGSSDRTAEIIAAFSSGHPFIRLFSIERGGSRSFGAQYRAINYGYSLVSDLEFEFICMQDADIEPVADDYFERLLHAFEADPLLGIAGGYVYERRGQMWQCRRSNSEHSVAGGVQMFRRSCYEAIGGYKPLVLGGEDWLAQIDAQVAGWGVRSLTDLPVHHHRLTSSADGRLRGLFRLGMRDASFGSHPAFEILKCGRRIGETPIVLNCCLRFAGYLWYSLCCRKPVLSYEKVRHLRRVELDRIKGLCTPRPSPGRERTRA